MLIDGFSWAKKFVATAISPPFADCHLVIYSSWISLPSFYSQLLSVLEAVSSAVSHTTECWLFWYFHCYCLMLLLLARVEQELSQAFQAEKRTAKDSWRKPRGEPCWWQSLNQSQSQIQSQSWSQNRSWSQSRAKLRTSKGSWGKPRRELLWKIKLELEPEPSCCRESRMQDVVGMEFLFCYFVHQISVVAHGGWGAMSYARVSKYSCLGWLFFFFQPASIKHHNPIVLLK